MDRSRTQVDAGRFGDHQSDHGAAVQRLRHRDGPRNQLGDDHLENRVRFADVTARAGRCLAELVIADGEASWRTIDGFVPLADGDEPTDPDGFRQWLEGVPLQRLRDLANGTQRCAFCEKSSTEVAKLVMGPKVGICNEYAALCAEIVSTQPDRGPRDHGRDR